MISRKTATGAVSLLAFAAIGMGAGPASASQTATAQAPAPMAGAPCYGWKNAGSVPLRWSTVSDGCAHFGAAGMKMKYAWKVYRGGSICVKVKGFNAQGRKTWYNAGCGKTGSISAPWGNNADTKEIMVKGGALLRWS